jgi:hypothetical protein
VLGVDFTWKTPPSAGGKPAQIKPPAASRVLLANNFLGVSADRPLQTVADGKYAVHYRPFFLPKATRLTTLSVFQETGNFSNDPSVGVGARFRCASGSASAPGTPTSKSRARPRFRRRSTSRPGSATSCATRRWTSPCRWAGTPP